MTPGARLQAAIELLDEVEVTPRPADAVISAFFRARRFIGAKDRAAVAETVYGVLRRHARLRWWFTHAGGFPINARTLLIADQILAQGRPADHLDNLFSGGRFAPAEFSAGEIKLANKLEGHTLDHPEMPEQVQVECPDWAAGLLREFLGDRFVPELAALLDPAPLDLRVNTVKGGRDAAIAALASAGIEGEPTRWSPFGVRIYGRPPLASTDAFKAGLVEIQDEGSQLIGLLTDAKPGHQVVDFCSGAGGKALAIAAGMQNKGRLVACDVLEKRLKRAAERFRRAGLHNIETRPLTSERDPWVKRHKGKFDRVLVDAPCTGTGTWRRNPDSRWRLLGPGLEELLKLQHSILDSAARLVKPGGRLIYATCSLLPQENERQIDAFLAAHPDFTVKPVDDLWEQAVGTASPGTGPYMRLSPARHGTDGFFAGVMERGSAVE
jgi:16S rRNA (cytosine967-C5)-methyltransferase